MTSTNQSYVTGQVTVTTTPTLVCTVPTENDDVMVYSSTATTLFGGPGVTATGATAGLPVPATTLVHIPSVGGTVHDLYAVTSTSTSVVTYLFPAV